MCIIAAASEHAVGVRRRCASALLVGGTRRRYTSCKGRSLFLCFIASVCFPHELFFAIMHIVLVFVSISIRDQCSFPLANDENANINTKPSIIKIL